MKKIVHKNNWFSIEKNIVDGQGEYYFLKKKPAVFIIAETIEKKIIFLQEYRYPIKKTIWQLPAGGVDNDNYLEAAKRELFEETGLKAKFWKKIGYCFVAPGHENTKIFVFYAKGLNENNIVLGKEKNIIDVKSFSRFEIIEMIRKKNIVCSITLAALNIFFLK